MRFLQQCGQRFCDGPDFRRSTAEDPLDPVFDMIPEPTMVSNLFKAPGIPHIKDEWQTAEPSDKIGFQGEEYARSTCYD